MVIETLALTLLAVAGACIARSVIRTSRRSEGVRARANSLMQGRDSLTPVQFANRYFPNNIDVAKSIHQILADCLIVDCSKIHPDDLLCEDLGLGQIDCLAPYHFAGDVSDELHVDLEPVMPNNSPTVREFIDYVAGISGDKKPNVG